MADNNKDDNEQHPAATPGDAGPAISAGDGTPAVPTNVKSGVSPDFLAFAKAKAEQAVAAATGKPASAEDDEEDPNVGERFSAVRPMDGEILVPASKIGIWKHHPRRDSRRLSDHASALALSAAEPLTMRPIVVLKESDGTFVVKDGRFRLEAIKAAHPDNEDVEVRCVLFPGTEAEAVQEICDEGLGTIGLTDIEQARALLSLKETSNISQTEVARRYRKLTITIVNNMLRAARAWHRWPDFFAILENPDRVSVDYGIKLFTLMKKLGADEKKALLDRARDLIENGERFSPAEALSALRVDLEENASEAITAELSKEQSKPKVEDIFGVDDQPVGTAERLAGERLRLTLPSSGEIIAMSASEREENAAPFIARIREHFGLNEEG